MNHSEDTTTCMYPCPDKGYHTNLKNEVPSSGACHAGGLQFG